MTPLLAVLLMLPGAQPEATVCQICPQCRTCHNCPTGWLWCDQHGARAYTPHEGDLVFLSRAAPLRTVAYWAFRTGHPLHVGMIVRRSDGCLALFETGGGSSKLTLLQSIRPRFAEQLSHLGGKILIRPVSRPLSYEESTRLTSFAESQVGGSSSQVARLRTVTRSKTIGSVRSWSCNRCARLASCAPTCRQHRSSPPTCATTSA